MIKLIKGKDNDGREIFAFVDISENAQWQMRSFQSSKMPTALSRLGKVLASGYGIPKESDFQYMREVYEFE